ncbi:MAG: NAD(P)-binding protein [Endomicrobium sp.]|jgi:protoporphyrinogen oxidase|nr:NAD(P)-binding protein [Endomicrobium sp.]
MKEKIIIIGAGISGLCASYFLNKPNTVLESKPYAGGLCRSFYEDGFTFDCSGHFIHIKDAKIKNLVEKLCGGIDTIKRNTAIYFGSKLIPFPFQANLYYLDEKTKKECVDGILKRKNIEINNKMSFIDWSKAMFGSGITKYFMQAYNEKLWSWDLKKLTAEWTGAFVPKPDAQTIAQSAYKKNKIQYGYNSVFYYPKTGGAQKLIDGLLKKTNPVYNAPVEKIDVKKKLLFTSGGEKTYKYSKIISTQPIVELVKELINAPSEIKKAASQLHSNSVRCINIGVKSKKGLPKFLKGKHWIYIPSKKIPFYRVGIYSNINLSLAPQNSYSFYIECSSANGIYEGAESVVETLIKLGFIGLNDEISALNIVDMPYAYVIFDKNREQSLKKIQDFLIANNIFSIGRYGAWEYSFIEKNILDAQRLKC